MKTLNDYMAMPYRMEIVEDKEKGGFVVSNPGVRLPPQIIKFHTDCKIPHKK